MPQSRPLQREQPHHKRAFEIYYQLGAKRSFRAVARELSLSVSTVRLVARSFQWTDRLQKREAAQTRQLADRSLGENAGEGERNLKIVRMALLKLAKDIHEGRIKGAVGDVDRLIRLEEYLTGKTGGMTENDVVVRLPADPVEREELAFRHTVNLCRRKPGLRHRVRAALAELDFESPPPSDKGVMEHATNPPSTA